MQVCCANVFIMCEKQNKRIRLLKKAEEGMIMAKTIKFLQRTAMQNSYQVLDRLLGNIGAGIGVFAKKSRELLFENHLSQSSDEIHRTMEESIRRFFSGETDDLGKKKEYYDAQSGLWLEAALSEIRWLDGQAAVVCTVSDITMRKKNQQKIEYQTHNDFLTGLYNRKKCEHDLRKEIRWCEEKNTKGALLFIDLDDFKHINDGLGHQYGDLLLQQVAAGLQGVPGMREHCYRMGGDEFGIIITDELYPEMEKTIQSITRLFENPWYLMETEYFCTMSMGIIEFPKQGAEANDLITKADIAMYDAKLAGKNQISYYQEGKDSASTKRLDIENNMRQAIAEQCDEFVVFYQPIMDIGTGECASCEALVRWNSSNLGFLGPGEFIPLAEYLGLIVSIGDYVLMEACRQCCFWNKKGYPELRVNVNLSVVQLMQKDAVYNIQRILESTGVNPENICLEVTETLAINDMDRVMKIIEGLKQLGLKIALDDFGTGYSSLNYIKKIPLDIVKVDKAFIDDVLEDDYAQAFIRLIVDLSKALKLKICVEGVETQEQYELLRELGVDLMQGYYFGKPVPAGLFQSLHMPRLK